MEHVPCSHVCSLTPIRWLPARFSGLFYLLHLQLPGILEKLPVRVHTIAMVQAFPYRWLYSTFPHVESRITPLTYPIFCALLSHSGRLLICIADKMDYKDWLKTTRFAEFQNPQIASLARIFAIHKVTVYPPLSFNHLGG